MKRWFFAPVLAFTIALLLGCGKTEEKKEAAGAQSVRLGFFPNVTHAPALVGSARGDFQRALEGLAKLEIKEFNAGPAAMEALVAGALDATYVGPSPAINTYVRSGGKAVRVLAGACSGGAALVAREGTSITRLEDLAGKRVAVPQYGGTQDVSLRSFLAAKGLKGYEKGGTVQVMPLKNPDILALFKRGELDAAWVPEPWTTRLLKEAHAKLVFDERDLWPNRRFISTVLVFRTQFAEKNPALVQALLRAHAQAVEWTQKNPDEAQKVVNEELKRITGKPLPPDILKESWTRVEFTTDPDRASIEAFARKAQEAGYLKAGGPDIAALVDLKALEQAQKAPAEAVK